MKSYLKFVSGIVWIFGAIYFWAGFLCLSVTIALIVSVHHKGKRWSKLAVSTQVYLVCLSVLSILLFFISILLIRVSMFRSYQDLPDIPREDAVEAITSRKAKDPSDKSFALHAILQKTSKREVPSLNYKIPIGQIYKDLFVQLIEMTDTLHLLRVAALNKCSGQPSWVTDWSKEVPSYWQDELRYHTSTGRNFRTSQPSWKWAPYTSDNLIVRGLEVDVILTCCRFRRTNDEFIETEAATHVENLTNALALLRFVGLRSCSFLVSSEEPWVQQHNVPTPRHYGMYLWQPFLPLLTNVSASDFLALLRGDHSGLSLYSRGSVVTGAWFHKILRLHILISNYLATTKRKNFACKESAVGRYLSSYRLGLGMTGIATNDVQPGDRIILVSGVPTFLIVRDESD